MTGIQIQYLLGLYFLIISLGFADSRISAEWIKFFAGLVLLLLAFLGVSLVN